MKRLVFLVTSVFIFFACENDIIDVDKMEDSFSLETKSASTAVDVISQLNKQAIPIYIIFSSIDSNNGLYLSGQKKRNEVVLERNVGDNRQKWLIVQGVTNGFVSNKLKVYDGAYSTYLASRNGDANFDNCTATLVENLDGIEGADGLKFLNYSNDFYNIHSMTFNMFNPNGPYNYLGASGIGRTNLTFSTQNKNNGLGVWKIQPVEKFKIDSISYLILEGDNALSIPQYAASQTYRNQSSTAMTYKGTFSEEFTETSKFSSMDAISLSFQTTETMTYGVPTIDAQGSMSVTQKRDQGYTFSQEQTQTYKHTITQQYELTVPPYTNIEVKALISKYEMRATYVGHFHGERTGVPLNVSGKWSGIQAYGFDLKAYNIDTGKPVDIAIKKLD